LLARVAVMRPVRTRRPWLQLGVVAPATLALSAALLWRHGGLRRDLAESPSLWVAAALCLVGYLLQLYWVLVPQRGQVLPLRPAPLQRAASLSALLVGGLLIGARLVPFAGDVRCLFMGLGVAAIPALSCLWLLRRTLASAGWPLTCAVGAAAGALGGLFLQLQCPSRHAAHLVGVHGAAIALPALLLMALSRSWRQR
jgi:hypothetical protein